MNLDPERFKVGNSPPILRAEIHPYHFTSAVHKGATMFPLADPVHGMTALGAELWVICRTTRDSDPIHQIAAQALKTGDSLAYLVLLDKLEEDGIATAEDNELPRLHGQLWQAGLVGEEIDRAVAEISRVKGRVKRALLYGFTVRSDKSVKVRRALRVKA
jgi:hypothetical protein